YKRAVTTVILENQEKAMGEDRAFLSEAAPANQTAGVANWDPILISLVRRAMPSLIAYDICGVQPMTGPTGLIFAMKARYTSQANSATEALFNEANTFFSSEDAAVGTAQVGTQVLKALSAATFTTGTGMTTAAAEALGDSTGNAFNQMAFSIEKATVTAKSRALKAEYTMELAQDLKAIHGLDAETELANILSAEILAEINREVVRTIYMNAKVGAFQNVANAGIFDLDTDSGGRWSVEKFKGLMFAMERDANVIARDTRRGKGNIILCSADVASAMTMAGLLDYQSALQDNLNVDSTGNTFAGVLNGRFKVYVDPYMNMEVPFGASGATAAQYYVCGYRGTSPYDAGLFYCPYVPLQMVRAVGEQTFQPKIGFKTRYGMQVNPFAQSAAATDGAGARDSNVYYRRVQVMNLM
ncbi:MAG: ATP-binding protein, partial [Chloroflexota bacterium]|nr:ATP-binding protein [Chloroflexota bacterium]